MLLDIPAREGLQRASKRAEHDKLEQESLEFHNRVRYQFRMLAESRPRRYLVLNALLSEDELADQILARVTTLLPDVVPPGAAPAPDGLAVIETGGTVESVTLGPARKSDATAVDGTPDAARNKQNDPAR